MALLDFDLGSLFKKKEDSSSGEKKKSQKGKIDRTVIIRIVIGVSLILLLVVLYYFFLKPILTKQLTQIEQVKVWQQQIQSCEAEITNLTANIENLKNESQLKGVLFVSDDEFENFYAELTEATIKNGLRIINIERGEEVPVRINEEEQEESSYDYTPLNANVSCEQGSKYAGMANNSSNQTVDPNCEGDNCGPIAYYKMSVEYEIKGGFGNYVSFRNVLANKAKIVNIENESIDKDPESNGIVAKAKVSLVKSAN